MIIFTKGEQTKTLQFNILLTFRKIQFHIFVQKRNEKYRTRYI